MYAASVPSNSDNSVTAGASIPATSPGSREGATPDGDTPRPSGGPRYGSIVPTVRATLQGMSTPHATSPPDDHRDAAPDDRVPRQFPVVQCRQRAPESLVPVTDPLRQALAARHS